MALSYDKAHVAEALARLLNQYAANVELVAILTAAVTEIQDIEDATQAFANLLSIANSSGTQLDGIGQILDQQRQGMPDAQYRLWLTAKSLAISSDGSSQRLLAIAALLLPSFTPIQLQDLAAQEGLIRINTILPTTGSDVAAILNLARSAGNRLLFEWHTIEPVFAFAGGAAAVNLLLNGSFDSWTAGNPDNWTKQGTDAHHVVSQVGSGQGHGGGGLGSLNLWCDTTVAFNVFQTVNLTVGKQYTVTFTISFFSGGQVEVFDAVFGQFSGVYTSAGTYSLTFNATFTTAEVMLSAISVPCNITFDDVIVQDDTHGFAVQLMDWTTNNPSGFPSVIGGMQKLNGATIIVDQSGNVAISQDDGFTWTVHTALVASAGTVSGIAYGNGIWVIASGTTFLWSSDLVTWTSVNGQFSGHTVKSVRYGGGYFIAVGTSGTISVSPDGKVWTLRSAGASGDTYFDVAFGVPAGTGVATWVAFASSGHTSASLDTVSWTEAHTVTGNIYAGFFAVISGGSGRFFLSADTSDVFYTEDGFAWLDNPAGTNTPTLFQFNSGAKKLLFGDNTGALYESVDGATWGAAITTIGGYATCADFLLSTSGRVWMVGSHNGSTYISSDYGVTWTAVATTFGSAAAFMVAGAVDFIAGSATGKVLHTTQDGGALSAARG